MNFGVVYGMKNACRFDAPMLRVDYYTMQIMLLELRAVLVTDEAVTPRTPSSWVSQCANSTQSHHAAQTNLLYQQCCLPLNPCCNQAEF